MDTIGGDQKQYMVWNQLREDYEEQLTFSHDPSITEDNSDTQKSWESEALTAPPNLGNMSVRPNKSREPSEGYLLPNLTQKDSGAPSRPLNQAKAY